MTQISPYPPPYGVYSSRIAVIIEEEDHIFLGPDCNEHRSERVIGHESVHAILFKIDPSLSRNFDNLCPIEEVLDEFGIPQTEEKKE